jgi:hypothetical protein
MPLQPPFPEDRVLKEKIKDDLTVVALALEFARLCRSGDWMARAAIQKAEIACSRAAWRLDGEEESAVNAGQGL